MFISRHTLKWTKTCRSSGDFPHAHTAHFLLNRHMRDGEWEYPGGIEEPDLSGYDRFITGTDDGGEER